MNRLLKGTRVRIVNYGDDYNGQLGRVVADEVTTTGYFYVELDNYIDSTGHNFLALEHELEVIAE